MGSTQTTEAVKSLLRGWKLREILRQKLTNPLLQLQILHL